MGAHPQNKITIRWSSEFAYAIGLLVTMGAFPSDGRHVDLTSKDKEQLVNFMKCLKIKNKIGFKTSGYHRKRAMRVQFSDVNFYNFLFDIGLMPNKSKVLETIAIPDEYFSIFYEEILMEMGHFILIGIRDGDQAICSIPHLPLPAKNIFLDEKRNFPAVRN